LSVSIRDPRFAQVVGPSVEFERIATGCIFTEGPLWHPAGQYLLWSDMPGDHLRRWSAKDGVTTFRKPCNMSNGLTWDRQGRLLACEHASSQVSRTETDGRITPVATHYQGKQLNSPNDIVCARDGGIYFSDPPYGRMKVYGVPREQELSFQGVFRAGSDAKSPTLLVDDFDRPNGLCFSLDERRLFVNDTARKHVRVFDVGPGGRLTNGRVWAETVGEGAGAPDGMKIDSAGNLYCCGPGGIHVFDPGAACLGVIHVPEHTANFAWGDTDNRSLYITASTSVYRMRVKTPGLPAL
jgi:gluconolactonase